MKYALILILISIISICASVIFSLLFRGGILVSIITTSIVYLGLLIFCKRHYEE